MVQRHWHCIPDWITTLQALHSRAHGWPPGMKTPEANHGLAGRRLANATGVPFRRALSPFPLTGDLQRVRRLGMERLQRSGLLTRRSPGRRPELALFDVALLTGMPAQPLTATTLMLDSAACRLTGATWGSDDKNPTKQVRISIAGLASPKKRNIKTCALGACPGLRDVAPTALGAQLSRPPRNEWALTFQRSDVAEFAEIQPAHRKRRLNLRKFSYGDHSACPRQPPWA